MKTNQKGFSLVEVLIIVVVIGVLGGAGWLVYDRQKSKTDNKDIQASQQKQKQETKAVDPYEGWKTGTFKSVQLSYKLPPNWQDISDNTKFQEGDEKYEVVELEAPDGFVLSMSVNNLPRGYEDFTKYPVLEYKDIDNSHQWIITDDGNGKVSRIYVGSGVKKVGQEILPIANVGRDGQNIELSGYYSYEIGSLTEFDQKQSVKEAKLVFESLKF